MFGLGVGEILLILIVVLLVFGPTKLPDLARTLGRGMAEFRRASRDMRETFEFEMYKMDEDNKTRRPELSERKVIDAQVEPAAGATVPRQVLAPPAQTTAAAQPPPAAEPAGGTESGPAQRQDGHG